jgi:hypothetical protein
MNDMKMTVPNPIPCANTANGTVYQRPERWRFFVDITI